MRVRPRGEAGIVFQVERGTVPVTLDCAVPAPRRAVLAAGGARVESVEHVLAALSGAGIWRAIVELEGPELPALDGSASAIYAALLAASRPDATADVPPVTVQRRHRLVRGHSVALLVPASSLRVSVRIDIRGRPCRFRGVGIGDFPAFADARTFAYSEELESLRRTGLARGGTIRNALVLDAQGRPLPPNTLSSPDEPARHKVLDVFGDLALLGRPLLGQVTLVRPGHSFTLELLRSAVAAGAIG